jgi:chemotaxis protein MotB
LRDATPKVVVEYETRPEGSVTDTTAGKSDLEAAAAEAAMAAEEATAAAQAMEVQRQLESREAEMAALEEEIRKRVAENDELRDYVENLRFDRTPEGLRVQIVDNEGRSMFERGSSRIEPRTRDLIGIIATAVADLPNPIAISGHTDSVPYARQAGYSNWELSADRANATRRIMVEAGVNATRINRISGLADTLPLNPEVPTAAENRRISVLISYPPIPATNGAAGADQR